MGIATVCLGLAPNYWLAVAARCLGGLSNGSGVAIKTMLAESCDANTQAKGMAYLNLGWGLGNICGESEDLLCDVFLCARSHTHVVRCVIWLLLMSQGP